MNFERIKCKVCKTNYGSENRDWLCSVCFQNEQQLKLVSEVSTGKPEVKADEDNSKPKQENIYNCWFCEKKVGHLGFKCSCGYIFCKGHRHFSDHSCTFDFKSKK